jgi:hypothetical protein
MQCNNPDCSCLQKNATPGTDMSGPKKPHVCECAKILQDFQNNATVAKMIQSDSVVDIFPKSDNLDSKFSR